MAKEKTEVFMYTCDACNRVQYAATVSEEPPQGIIGIVEEHTNTGGIGNVDWFACQRSCIETAVINAIERAWSA